MLHGEHETVANAF